MPNRGLPVVVIGSGAAGLFTALQAAPVLPVLVLTRAGAAEANTAWAQGGIAAALGHGDSPRSHLEDTVAAGAGLVDEAAARVLCDEGPARIRELAALGTPFDLSGGTFALGREAAHSANRIVHAGGDRTGARLEQALLAAARAAGVTIQDMSEVTGIIVEHGRARGVRIRTVAGAERADEEVLPCHVPRPRLGEGTGEREEHRPRRQRDGSGAGTKVAAAGIDDQRIAGAIVQHPVVQFDPLPALRHDAKRGAIDLAEGQPLACAAHDKGARRGRLCRRIGRAVPRDMAGNRLAQVRSHRSPHQF